MNWVDIVIIAALVVSTFVGYKVGLIKIIIPLAGMLLATILSGALHSYLGDKLGFIDSENWANIAAFIIVFLIVFAIVYIVASILRKIIQLMLLGWVDRLAGAALVFVVGWIVCSMIVVLVAKYGALGADYVPGSTVSSESIEDMIDDSALATFQIDKFPIVLGLLPGEFDVVRDYFGD